MKSKHVFETRNSNGYPTKFINDVYKRLKTNKETAAPEELVREFFALVDPPTTSRNYAVLPYIKGLTEPLTRVLRNFDIRVFNLINQLKQSNKNSHHLKTDHMPISRRVLFTKLIARTVNGATSEKLVVALKLEEKNI